MYEAALDPRRWDGHLEVAPSAESALDEGGVAGRGALDDPLRHDAGAVPLRPVGLNQDIPHNTSALADIANLAGALLAACTRSTEDGIKLGSVHEKGNANRATLAVARKMVAYLLAVDRREKAFVVPEDHERNAA